MSRAPWLLLLTIALLGLPLSAAADPVTGLASNGPYGGFGRLLNHPPGSDTLYLGSFGGGLYHSLDRGQSWLRVPFGIAGHTITAVAGDPFDGHRAFAGTPNAGTPIIRTTDGGATWQGLGAGIQPGYAAWSIAADPGVPGRIYAAGGASSATPSGSRALFRSDDHGDTWEPIPVDSVDALGEVNSGSWLLSVLVSPTNPQRLYVSWANSVALRSDDGGATWVHLETSLFPDVLPDLLVRGLQFDGATDAEIVMVAQKGVFKSWDAGEHWTRLDDALPTEPWWEDRISYTTDPADSLTRYVSLVFRGTYVTHDAGATWAVLCDSLRTRAPGLWFFDSAPREILSSDTRRAVVRSTDDLASFESLNQGITACLAKSLAWDPSGARLYAGTTYCGAFVSLDGGGSWGGLQMPTTASIGVRALATSHADPLRVFACIDKDTSVCRSDDGGATWTRHAVAANLTSPSCLVVHPDSESTVWLGANSGLYVSRDAGVTWVGGRPKYPMTAVLSLRFHPQDPSVVYAATSSGVWRSAHNDSGWTKITTKAANTVAINPARPEVLMLGVSASLHGPGVWRSEDAGATWTRVGMDGIPVFTVEFDPADTSRVYAGTAWRGVWASEDGGRAWAPTALDSEYVSAIAFRPNPPQALRGRPGAGSSRATALAFPPNIRFATQTQGVLSPVATTDVPPPASVAAHGLQVRAWRDGALSRVIVSLDRADPLGVVQVFDVAGRNVRELHRGALRAGATELQWDGGTRDAGPASSGLYFILARTSRGTAACRVVVLR